MIEAEEQQSQSDEETEDSSVDKEEATTFIFGADEAPPTKAERGPKKPAVEDNETDSLSEFFTPYAEGEEDKGGETKEAPPADKPENAGTEITSDRVIEVAVTSPEPEAPAQPAPAPQQQAPPPHAPSPPNGNTVAMFQQQAPAPFSTQVQRQANGMFKLIIDNISQEEIGYLGVSGSWNSLKGLTFGDDPASTLRFIIHYYYNFVMNEMEQSIKASLNL